MTERAGGSGWGRQLIIVALVFSGLLVVGTVLAGAAWYWIGSSGAELTLTPAFSMCLLVPGVLLALVLSAFLYREQRRMAPFGAVLALTLLRLALILLLAVLFLQPALRWKSTRTSAGTLWVIVDQSPSMQASDGQATAGERLHWAEGLGLISRKVRPDALAMETRVLADELDSLAPDPGSGGWGGDEKGAVKAAADRLDAWVAKLRKFSAEVEESRSALNGFERNAGNVTASELHNALGAAERNVANVRAAHTMWDAKVALNRQEIGSYLGRAREMLATAADAADAAYLKQAGGSQEWNAAGGRVGSAARSDLAGGYLTDGKSPATERLQQLAREYTVRVGSFSDKAQSAGSVDAGSLPETLRSALVPSGQSTNLAGALQFVAEQIPGDEAASVVIVGDGRTNMGGDPTSPARNLAARGVHVYGLLIGSHELSPDAAVEPVDFPDWIFAGDTIKPRALIRLDGLEGQTATVELRRGGQLMDTRTVLADKPHAMVPFDFTDKPPETDTVLEYEIRVSQMKGEVNTQNNVATFRVAVKKDKLYALIIEDQPRWEYRYLAAYLGRRPGMKLQTVLLNPAVVAGVAGVPPVTASPDNPRTEATALPGSLAEWQRFDVIVVGDVGPETLTPQMQQFIASAVRDKGSTLITIAGPHAMPEKYLKGGGALAELLPVTGNVAYPAGALDQHLRNGFMPESAPTAGMSVLAQLGGDAGSNGRAWQNMPPWYWHSAYTQAKPAASVAWTIGEVTAGAQPARAGAAGTVAEANEHALLATMSVGLGHSLYMASDQSWRLRQVGGLNLHERFWGQVLNWAVGSDLPAGGKYVRFGANQPAYEQTQPVIITARVLRDDLTPYTGLSFSAVARPVKGGAAGGVEARFEPMESPGYYQATLSGLPIGDDEITLKGAEVERLLNSDPTATLKSVLVKVYPTMNAERQNMNADPTMMEMVARAGGGFSVDGEYAEMLLSRLPKIEHTEASIYQLGFFTDPKASGTKWAHWTFLALFVVLITVEWAVRKLAGLV